MNVQNSSPDDLDEIFRLYAVATAYQKSKNQVLWPMFNKNDVLEEIKEKRQWKLVDEGIIIGIWATTFNDAQIWEERNIDPSVYIHRIAVNPTYRGGNIVQKIITWAKPYALTNRKQFIRLDTVGDNKGLIKYYEKCGFTFLGLHTLKNTEGLYGHYKDGPVSLFEIEV